MFWQWQLYNKAINISIIIKFINFCQQFGFCNIALITDKSRFKAALLASFDFMSYVSFATSVMTHQNCSKMWRSASICYYLIYFFGNFLLNLVCYCFSVD